MGLAILAWLVLLYLFSSKPSWFACLLVFLVVGILVAGRMSASPVSEALAGLVAFTATS
jgi:FtsH-binding integral membrane protein